MNAAAQRWSGPLRAVLLAAASRSLSGTVWAAIAILIWAGYPAVTRLSVTNTLQPEDLFALRFGISAALFLPYLARNAAAWSSAVWAKGVGLTACQGTVAALVIVGLQFAPASHASALVQGVMPVWVLLLGAMLFNKSLRGPSTAAVLLIASGAVLLVGANAAEFNRHTFVGDALFSLAALLAGGYVLQMRRADIPATAGAALVAVYSALVFLPWYLASGASERLATVAWSELVLQAAYQGVLLGFVSFIALNRAIAALGGTRTSALLSLVPVLSALVAIPILGERPSGLDCIAIAVITIAVAFVSRTPATAGARTAPFAQ